MQCETKKYQYEDYAVSTVYEYSGLIFGDCRARRFWRLSVFCAMNIG